ncbi:hypothetical protein K501DRAFT_102125 [Backusella circina FSU 941]|nr:hypothetical protein K501DRAFT_102125 [Backusella circina FSU 941]
MVFVTKNKQPNVKSVDGSTVDDEDKALEKKNQNSLFEHEKSTPEAQTKELQSLKEGKSNYEIQIKEKDNKISLLESENSELKRERADLEHQIKARDNQISILENEKRFYHSSYTQQTQRLNSLMPEKLTMEQERNHTIDEMERLRSSFTTLEQLLKSKEDAMLSLYSEQEVNGIMETLTSLLQAKGSEVKLSKSNVKPTLDRKKKRNKMLQKEIEMLKQKQYQQGIHSQKASSPNNSTVLSGHASNADISNNGGDINNDMECGATDDDINYDTPSES